jgi:biopolymer transport protein ExbD
MKQVLVLLVFLSFCTKGQDPNSVEPYPQIGHNSDLTVSISENNSFHIGNNIIPETDLLKTIKDLSKSRNGDHQMLYIRSTPKVAFDSLRHLLLAAREANLLRFGLITNGENGLQNNVLQVEILSKEQINKPIPLSTFVVESKSGSGIWQEIELNSKPMSLSEALVTLRDLLRFSEEKEVLVKPRSEQTYEELIALIGIIKNAGANRMGLIIGNETGRPAIT